MARDLGRDPGTISRETSRHRGQRGERHQQTHKAVPCRWVEAREDAVIEQANPAVDFLPQEVDAELSGPVPHPGALALRMGNTHPGQGVASPVRRPAATLGQSAVEAP